MTALCNGEALVAPDYTMLMRDWSLGGVGKGQPRELHASVGGVELEVAVGHAGGGGG